MAVANSPIQNPYRRIIDTLEYSLTMIKELDRHEMLEAGEKRSIETLMNNVIERLTLRALPSARRVWSVVVERT